jgi:hypothetical protein
MLVVVLVELIQTMALAHTEQLYLAVVELEANEVLLMLVMVQLISVVEAEVVAQVVTSLVLEGLV